MSSISTDQTISNVLAFKQAEVQQDVDTAVATEALGAAKQSGAAVLNLLSSAVQLAQTITSTHVDVQA